MEVPSIESGNTILEQLGFSFRNYQEKKRNTYILDDIEIVSCNTAEFLQLILY